MDFSKLAVRDLRGNYLARPALCVFLYSDEDVHKLAPSIAAIIDSYLQLVDPTILKTYVGNNGEHRELTPRRLKKDLTQLRDFPSSQEASAIEYDSDPDGWVGEFGIYVDATGLKTYEYEKETVNQVRLDFPADYLNAGNLDSFLEYVIHISEIFPFQCGNVGFAFKRSSGTKNSATRGVNQLLPRYLGFDPCYPDIQDVLRGHTFTAHWINLLGPSLVDAVGGYEEIVAKLPNADVRRLRNGVFIRAAKSPPIGDANRQAPDIGLTPDLARLLRPTRVALSGLGSPDFDATAWLARFDDMKSRPWDQSAC